MTTYKLVKNPISGEINSVLKDLNTKNTLSIPFDEANTDYQAYLEWKAIDGNEPEAAD